MKKMRTKRDGIREASLKGEKLRNLMIHFNERNLAQCFHDLDINKAVGIDRITKEEYGRDLKFNLQNLVGRLKSLSYRPKPSRQVLIPKANGKLRPLAISSLEDKIIQLMFKKLLEAVYEPVFLNCSYGFRPGRSAHDAIKDLNNTVFPEFKSFIIDVDLENYFNEIPHDKLVAILGMKISDERFLRYISRLLKSGIMINGSSVPTRRGSSQGSICSPVLANIYAHYCVDSWFEQIKVGLRGRAHMVRFADDIRICLTNKNEVERVLKGLKARLKRFGLKLNDDKTSVVTLDRKAPRKGQTTLKFLGFEFYIGATRKGKPVVKIKTAGKTLRRSLKELNKWIKENRNRQRMKLLWAIFCSKIRGHIQYFGVSGNAKALESYCHLAKRMFFKWMNRRSQKRSFNWEKFHLFLKVVGMPKPYIVHPLY